MGGDGAANEKDDGGSGGRRGGLCVCWGTGGEHWPAAAGPAPNLRRCSCASYGGGPSTDRRSSVLWVPATGSVEWAAIRLPAAADCGGASRGSGATGGRRRKRPARGEGGGGRIFALGQATGGA